MRQIDTIRRLAAASAIAALLVSAVGAMPVTARVPASGAQHVTQRQGAVLDRGHVNATQAAAAAAGVVRPASTHRRLTIPAGTPTAGTALQQPTRLRSAGGPKGPALDAPQAVAGWQGLNQSSDSIFLDPPDPWVAVNSSFVVQSVNSRIRIYDRSGNALLSLPTWALFALSTAESDADPRIIWDAAHGRWVGVLLSYIEPGATVDAAWLNLAISDGPDPRGSWQILSYGYGDGTHATLPDYPGLASTSDTIVLTANEFDYTKLTFLGASILTFKWSDILAGNTGSEALWTSPDPDTYSIRPAISQGSLAGAQLVASDANTGDLLYARLATPGGAVVWQDVTTSLLLPGVFDGVPTAPWQPGPDTIANAVTARLTDAIWRSNRLAFVSTYNDGINDYARVTVLGTASAAPTKVADVILGAGLGTDAYMGGVGFTTNGALIVCWTESSAAEYTRTMVARIDPDSVTTSASTQVDSSDTAYSYGERWGDYVGVATDPAGSDTVWIADEITAYDGGWDTTVQRISVDAMVPVITAPTQSLVAGTTLGSYAVPVKVAWTATDAGSGVGASNLGISRSGAGFELAGVLTTTSVTRLHPWKLASNTSDYSNQYAVFAWDNSGNTTGVLAGPVLTPVVYQQTSATFTGTWTTKSGSTFAGGSVKYSKIAGASASFKTSARSFAFVTTKGSAYGKARVYVDGVLKTTLALGGASRYRNLAYVINFASPGTHTVKVVVASGRVDVDAFLVLR
ncbi:MAG: hypothetical protein WCK58_14215 [Chloroflexota bacterium]